MDTFNQSALKAVPIWIIPIYTRLPILISIFVQKELFVQKAWIVIKIGRIGRYQCSTTLRLASSCIFDLCQIVKFRRLISFELL